MSHHFKKPAVPPTVILVCAFNGEDYFIESKRGYSEDEAFADILNGQVEDVQQAFLMTADGSEDITARLANRIARRIEQDNNVAVAAVDFAIEHAGYEPPKAPLTYFDRIDHEQQRRRA